MIRNRLGPQKLAPINGVCALLAVLAFVAMWLVSPFDQAWVLWLHENRWPAFADFQDRSLFAGGALGGSDISLLFQVGCGLAFLGAVVSPSVRLRLGSARRAFCGLVFFSALYSGVVVQGLKFAWGRARPYIVFDDDLKLYSDWYEPGLHTLEMGRYVGSFPSGHSVSAAAFFALLYWHPLCRPHVPLQRFLQVLLFLAAVLFWLLMCLARPMTRDHFLTDCLASGVVGALSLVLVSRCMRQQEASSPVSVAWSFQARPLIRLFSVTFSVIVLVGVLRELFHTP